MSAIHKNVRAKRVSWPCREAQQCRTRLNQLPDRVDAGVSRDTPAALDVVDRGGTRVNSEVVAASRTFLETTDTGRNLLFRDGLEDRLAGTAEQGKTPTLPCSPLVDFGVTETNASVCVEVTQKARNGLPAAFNSRWTWVSRLVWMPNLPRSATIHLRP